MINTEFLNINDLSRYLGIKQSTLYLKVKRHEIPFYRFSRLIRFKKAEIDRWTEEFQCKSGDLNSKKEKCVRSKNRVYPNVERIVKKTIEDVKRPKYTGSYGKPDKVKGLGKEVKNGIV